ncbi:hypothetical protein Tco_0508862, partial [Tanacetum coccineum]
MEDKLNRGLKESDCYQFCMPTKANSDVHSNENRILNGKNSEALLILVKRNPTVLHCNRTMVHSTREISRPKQLQIPTLQGKDATYASPRVVQYWMKKVVDSAGEQLNECDAFDSDVERWSHHTGRTKFIDNLNVRMLLKMKALYVWKTKLVISPPPPPDYAKENLLATFAPQRNLTPEQIFWSIDDNRKKAETLARKPISTLTVYPPNTPVKLVPRILPTKSQVKINLYVLTQLFTEFDKTCKTRITPSGLTEGERGFEQTKRCYLTEVIPFFKTLKEHFVGVQTALFKEVKVMEEIFDQMNNEVDKNTVDKQCAEIEKKNLLIENENLIVNCLSTQLLYDVAKSRCLDLEADVSKVHDESKLISKLEREYLNMQLKYQHLQESFDNKNSQASQEAPDFRSFFKIKNLEHQIQEKDNVIRQLKDRVANVNDSSRVPYNAIDVTAL